MADPITLTAQPRTTAGRGPARDTRRQLQIPGIVYGNDQEPQMISIERKAVEQELAKPGFFIRPVNLDVGGKKQQVLPRDVQYHPVSDKPLHIDFMRLSPDREIRVAVPVRFLNGSPPVQLPPKDVDEGGIVGKRRRKAGAVVTIPGDFQLLQDSLDDLLICCHDCPPE